MNFIKAVIPAKYIISEELLKEYTECIAIAMPPKKTGRPRNNDVPLIAGMYYLLRTGCQWDALPLCFGSSKTIHDRFMKLTAAGIFQKIWKNILLKKEKK